MTSTPEINGIAEIIEAARLADITYTVPTDINASMSDDTVTAKKSTAQPRPLTVGGLFLHWQPKNDINTDDPMIFVGALADAVDKGVIELETDLTQLSAAWRTHTGQHPVLDVQSTTVRGHHFVTVCHQQGMFNDTNAVKIVKNTPVVA